MDVPNKLIVRNTVLNLVGLVVPLAVGFITIPMVVRALGNERFGILALVWVVLGYFGLFDLGLGGWQRRLGRKNQRPIRTLLRNGEDGVGGFSGRVLAEHRRKVRDAQQVVLAESAGAFDGVLELAHVTRPIVSTKGIHDLTGDLVGLAGSGVDLFPQEMSDEQGNVIRAFPEARHVNGLDGLAFTRGVRAIPARAARIEERQRAFPSVAAVRAAGDDRIDLAGLSGRTSSLPVSAEALYALLLAVVLSLLALVWRTSKGRISELGLARGKLTFEAVGATSDAAAIKRLLIFAPEESLFFANADTVRVQITNRLAASAEPVDSVLLDLELTNELDVPSADMLKDLHDDLDAGGVRLLLARVRPAVRALLDRNEERAPIVTLGGAVRPENRRMMQLLKLRVTEASAEELYGFDRLITVDTQPRGLDGVRRPDLGVREGAGVPVVDRPGEVGGANADDAVGPRQLAGDVLVVVGAGDRRIHGQVAAAVGGVGLEVVEHVLPLRPQASVLAQDGARLDDHREEGLHRGEVGERVLHVPVGLVRVRAGHVVPPAAVAREHVHRERRALRPRVRDRRER